MTGSLPKKIIPVTGLQSREEQIWVFNKSVYVDCMEKQVAVQTVKNIWINQPSDNIMSAAFSIRKGISNFNYYYNLCLTAISTTLQQHC